MIRKIADLIRCARGATAIEYAIIVTVLSIAAVGVVSQLGNLNTGIWDRNAARISDAGQ
jgi:Flp pilus assembly pilin Flp